MDKLPLPLKVLILDAESASAKVLKTIIETKPDIETVHIFDQTEAANCPYSAHRGIREHNRRPLDVFSTSWR